MLSSLLTDEYRKQGFLFRINPLSKLLLSLFIFIYSLTINSAIFQLTLFMAILILLLTAGLYQPLIKIMPLSLLVGGSMLAISYYWGSGLENALIFALRILILFTVFIMFGATTDASTYLRALHTLKIPIHLSIGLLITFRFIPVLAAEMQKIALSFSLRKKNSRPSLKTMYRGFMVPFVFRLFTLSDDLALTLHVRGYGSTERPTMFKNEPFKKSDFLFIFSGCTLIVALHLIITGFYSAPGS